MDTLTAMQSSVDIATHPETGGWAPIWSEGAKQIMFSDIDLAVMMQIVAKVIQGGTSAIFSGNLPGSSAAASSAP